jgi:hypothetical protein
MLRNASKHSLSSVAQTQPGIIIGPVFIDGNIA